LVRRNVIYLGTPQGLTARKVVDGSLLWESGGGQPAGALALGKHWMAYVNTAGELVLVSVHNGEVLKRMPGALPEVPPLVARDAVLYATTAGLMRYASGGAAARLWMRTDWIGPITAPPVMADSHVYFGAAKRGLVCLKGKEKRP
jgi:hypothetical protein